MATATKKPEVTIQSQLAERTMQRLARAGVNFARPGEKSALPSAGEGPLQEITQVAIANQAYYLAEAKRTGRAWFQHPKQNIQYSEFVLVSPEMAAECLKFNRNIRNITDSSAAAYGRDIGAGNWVPTDESISITTEGNLANGQHRMEGVIRAEKPAVFYVTWQVLPEAQFVIDSGRKRNVSDKLRLVINETQTSKMPSLARSMMRGTGSITRFSETEIAEFCMIHKDLIRWGLHALPGQRADVVAAVCKAALWYGQERLEPFCYRLKNTMFASPTDPAGVLYKWLIRTKNTSGITVYRKALTAVNRYLEDRELRNIFECETDIFEWLPMWQVPAKP